MIEEACKTFDKHRPRRDSDNGGAIDKIWDNGPVDRNERDDVTASDEDSVSDSRNGNNSTVNDEQNDIDNNNNNEESSQTEQRQRERRRRRRERRRREVDMEEYEDAMFKMSKARHIMDRRMAVIDVAHQYNWDIAQRFQDKRQPVKDKDLKAAIEEANKAAETKKEKADKERRSRSRYRMKEYSPKRCSRSPRRRSRSPREYGHTRSYEERFRYGQRYGTEKRERERPGGLLRVR